MKRIHFIAIGGAAMHNLALALHHKGMDISGSDDEIFDPAKSRLADSGLLPAEAGWFPGKITPDLDAVILGMHARKDNPELLRAQELKVKIFSYPEFLYEQTKNKTRIAIGGSHGKTTITSMVMHVLKEANIEFDYMVGAQIEGFDTMVHLSNSSKIAVFEGDEYLSSPIDQRPKFHLYKPHIGVINGIAWDHINVFPTFEIYREQFEIFIGCIQPHGELIYCEGDDEVKKLINKKKRSDIAYTSYDIHPYTINHDKLFLTAPSGNKVPLNVIGKHNMQNIAAALNICTSLGVKAEDFYRAISTFSGSAKRLQQVFISDEVLAYVDFAHAPSKVRATVSAVREQFATGKLVALFELHTFSSLTKEYLIEYRGTLEKADLAIVYYNPSVVEHKKLPVLENDEVKESFQKDGLLVINDLNELDNLIPETYKSGRRILLFMSSGNFGGKKSDDLVHYFN